MKTSFQLMLLFIAGFFLIVTTHAQEYVSPTQPAETRKSPGVKVK